MTPAQVLRAARMPEGDRVMLPLPAQANTPVAAAPLAPPSPSLIDIARAEGLAQGMAEAERRIAAEIERREAVRQAGVAAQLERLYEERRTLAERVERVLGQLQQANAQAWVALERQACGLAFEAVCRVMAPLPGDPEVQRAQAAAAVVRQVLSARRDGSGVSLRIHPLDLELLASTLEGRQLQSLAPSVRWQADPELPPLTVVLDTECGQVEAALEQSLRRLLALWLDALGQSARPADSPREGTE